MSARALAYIVEPLHKRHDRRAFSCGHTGLDRYLREQATQDAKKRAAAPYVALVPETIAVVGYYTLSALAVPLAGIPADQVRHLPRYPNVPTTLLGRLAVDSRHQGHRLGEQLLIDALARSLAGSSSIASAAVVVDAINDRARAFYERYGFMRMADQPRRLFLPMATIQQLKVRG